MTGYIFIVQDRFFYMDHIGYAEISEVQSVNVQALSDVDRERGWRWIEAYRNLGAAIRRIGIRWARH